MTVSGAWFITPHAVERYIERHRPELAYDRALGELVLWSEVATKACETRTGDHEYHAEFPARIRFVVARESEGPLPALATVLPRRRRPTWVNLHVDVALMFDGLQSTDDRADRLESILPQFLAVRRQQYLAEKRANSIEYRRILFRARSSTARRQADPVRRQLAVTAARLEHTKRRATEIAERPPCPECGEQIGLVARMGRVRKFCSVRCSHLAAGRAYWRRKHGKGAPPDDLTRSARHWTSRDLDLLRSDRPAAEVAAEIHRTANAVQQKRRQLARAAGGAAGNGR